MLDCESNSQPHLAGNDWVPIQPRTPTDGACRRCRWIRFGSWCYSGTVQLTPTLSLADIPHVIPALRMQQTKLDFMCDVAQVRLAFVSPNAPRVLSMLIRSGASRLVDATHFGRQFVRTTTLCLHRAASLRGCCLTPPFGFRHAGPHEAVPKGRKSPRRK